MKQLLIILSFLYTTGILGAERIVTTSDGVELFVQVQGIGHPCLYVHGGPGSGSYWMQQFFGDFLEEQFTMVYLDQRGVGRSSTPVNLDYSINRMTLDFEEVREALGISQWTTLGHSFGGILQVSYAKNYPAVHKGLIMVNCTLNIGESLCQSWIPYACSLLGEICPQTCGDNALVFETVVTKIPELQSQGLLWKMMYEDPANEEKLLQTYSDLPKWNGSFSSQAFLIDDYWQDFKRMTPEVMIPVLFFYGEKDMSIGPEHYKGVKFPILTLRSADCGHMPFLEQRDALERAILEFTGQ